MWLKLLARIEWIVSALMLLAVVALGVWANVLSGRLRAVQSQLRERETELSACASSLERAQREAKSVASYCSDTLTARLRACERALSVWTKPRASRVSHGQPGTPGGMNASARDVDSEVLADARTLVRELNCVYGSAPQDCGAP